ncbi:MAG: undecaprenyl-diphosphatase [Chthoniobacteraceae bacterium]|nr:undecaprenyl-diphosphatase [Chthoniobacteraceae bacterium]
MLPAWLVVTLLGFIEGLTEFIPVSSTGHLLIAEHWLPRQTDLFNIVVQCGAVLAVLPLFGHRLAMLTQFHEPRSRDMLSKIFVAFFITGVGGLVLDKLKVKLPEEVGPVAWALILGGVAFIIVERWLHGRERRHEITWAVVIAVAAAQLLAAIFPGTSRSGATILFALILGTDRILATEFSFLVGIPTLLAAGAWKTFKELRHPMPGAPGEDWMLLLLATVVAAVVSFIAVKWLLRYIQTHTFTGFGFYRIVLGGLLLMMPYFLK